MRLRGASLAWLAVVGTVAAFLGANAHLAYLAFASQPRCVDHLRTGEGAPSSDTAAISSC